MKDYCETEYQRKTFIIKYEIDNKQDEIKIYYADDEILKVPYSLKEEIKILNQMKKQIKYYDHFIDNAKSEKNVLKFKKILAFGAASYGAVIFGYLGIGALVLGPAGLFVMPTIMMDVLIIMAIKRRYDQIDDKILEINESIKDYNKNVFYLRNEKLFTNERVMRKDVINNSPIRVKEIVNKNSGKDIPSINLNTLDDITMKDLKKTYEASLQSHGPELVLRPISKK